MKKIFVTIILCVLGLSGLQAATVYTKVNNKPAAGWPGTYIIVYESGTTAYVWNGDNNVNNYVTATISDGKITSENLTDCHITVTSERPNYGVKVVRLEKDGGFIGSKSLNTLGDKDIKYTKGAQECTLESNGGYVILETNDKTCRFLCQEAAGHLRFSFFCDKTKKWTDTYKHNICFYALGEVEQEDPQYQLDLQYAQADLFACPSQFPTQNNTVDQYFYTHLRMMQKESEEIDKNCVPSMKLEMYAPTQYSIAGEYTTSINGATTSDPAKYWINCENGSSHSIFYFPNKSDQGWGQAAIESATMKITKVGESSLPNAYKYHINLVFTDSNKKTWTLDKDLDVYAQWIDCDRSGKVDKDMDAMPFVLESGNHGNGTTDIENVQGDKVQCTKVLRDGQLYLMYNGTMYDVQGKVKSERKLKG